MNLNDADFDELGNIKNFKPQQISKMHEIEDDDDE